MSIIPSIGAKQVVSGVLTGIQKGGTFVEKYKWLRNTVGFLGSSFFFDENIAWGPSEKRAKEKPKGFFTFIRRYILANGYLLGLVGAIGWFVSRRFLVVEEGKQPGIKVLLANLGSLILTIASPIIALYSQIKRINVLWQCGKAGETRSNLEKLLTAFELRDNKKLLQRSTNSDLRFNQEEHKEIQNISNRKTIRKIFVGKPGTGKTEAMDLVAGQIVQQLGPDNVIVHKIECQLLERLIENSLKEEGQLINLAASLGAGSNVAEVLSWNSKTKLEKLKTVFDGILLNAQEAKKAKKRYILQLDELDKLQAFATYETEGKQYLSPDMFKHICLGLKDIWYTDKDKDYEGFDILATSNIDVNALFGIGTRFTGELKDALAELGKTEVGPIHSRLASDQCIVDLPEPKTQARIIARYLLKIKNTLQENDEQLFDNDLYDCVKEKSSESEKEDALTEFIFKNIYEKLKMDNEKGYKEYEDFFQGRALEKAIFIELANNELKTGGNRKPGVKIDLALIKKYLDKMMNNILGRTTKTEEKSSSSPP